MPENMKRFLLTAGELQYPLEGTGDWIGCYHTKAEAENHILDLCGQYEWYEIIDLTTWMLG